jgi:hypothetical protein
VGPRAGLDTGTKKRNLSCWESNLGCPVRGLDTVPSELPFIHTHIQDYVSKLRVIQYFTLFSSRSNIIQ